MKKTSAERLHQIMSEKNLSQKEILSLCKPYCEKYDVTISKSALSQYCSGKYEPDQRRLTILGMALNINEAWLMGYDVPKERGTIKEAPTSESVLTDFEKEVVNLTKTIPYDKRKDFIEYLKTAVKMMK